jgi:hypothetical protein
MAVVASDTGTGGVQSVGGGWYRCWATSASALVAGNPVQVRFYPGRYGVSSGSETTVIYGAQLEATAFPTSYIPTAGVPRIRTTSAGNSTGPVGMRWTMSTALKNALGAASPSVGTMLLEWLPGHKEADTTGNAPVISVADAAASIMYHNSSSAVVSADGTNSPTVTLAQVLATPYVFSTRWDSTVVAPTTGKLQVSEKHASTWTHGTATNYDGAFTLGTYLWLNYGNEYPAKIGRLMIRDDWVADGALDAAFKSGGLFQIFKKTNRFSPYRRLH